MKVRRSRVPNFCPTGFQAGYTVVQGDTMYLIARRFGIPLNELIEANPHITNPNLIYPGDVLCVPFELRFPCCVILTSTNPVPPLPSDAQGVALVRGLDGEQKQSVSILAVGLPPAETYGDFDVYEGFLSIPAVGGFGFALFPTPENPPTWAGSIDIGPFLTPSTLAQVRPVNSESGVSSPEAVLQGSLNNCEIVARQFDSI